MVVALAVILVAGFMIVPMEVFLRYRGRLLKNMMDTMGAEAVRKSTKRETIPTAQVERKLRKTVRTVSITTST